MPSSRLPLGIRTDRQDRGPNERRAYCPLRGVLGAERHAEVTTALACIEHDRAGVGSRRVSARVCERAASGVFGGAIFYREIVVVRPPHEKTIPRIAIAIPACATCAPDFSGAQRRHLNALAARATNAAPVKSPSAGGLPGKHRGQDRQNRDRRQCVDQAARGIRFASAPVKKGSNPTSAEIDTASGTDITV